LYLDDGYAGVLGIAAVKIPAQTTHGGRHFVALAELVPRCALDEPDRFNAQNTGELHIGRMTLPREEFGPVKSEGLYTDQDLVVSRFGGREALDLENLGSTRGANDGSLHHGHCESPSLPYARAGFVVEKQ